MHIHTKIRFRTAAFTTLTQRLMLGLVCKVSSLINSYRLTRHKHTLFLNPDFSQHFTSLLTTNVKHDSLVHAPPSDLQLVENIRTETSHLNRNNLTRTKAYWDIYRLYPDLHWALLAHMVSRNGGWCMTDLKGQWLPQLLAPSMLTSLFELLEACNSLIFGDAYPQLKLYAESKRRGENLFYLLPQFGVSSFMIAQWNEYWVDGDSASLTVALIINEQNFIQSRVIEDETYRTEVFSSLSFRSQPMLQMNQIVFPLWPNNRGSSHNGPMRLVGRVLENFESLQERIGFGKSLYGLLFGYPAVHERIIKFCEQVEHTGSRSDYWPQRFTSECKQITSGKLLRAEPATGYELPLLWMSPALVEAWPDRPRTPVTRGDWFQGLADVMRLPKIKRPLMIEMTHEHLFAQNKLQTAVLLERSFKNGASKRRTGRG